MKGTNDHDIGGRYAHYVLVVLILVYVFNFIDRNILSILAQDIKADTSATTKLKCNKRITVPPE